MAPEEAGRVVSPVSEGRVMLPPVHHEVGPGGVVEIRVMLVRAVSTVLLMALRGGFSGMERR